MVSSCQHLYRRVEPPGRSRQPLARPAGRHARRLRPEPPARFRPGSERPEHPGRPRAGRTRAPPEERRPAAHRLPGPDRPDRVGRRAGPARPGLCARLRVERTRVRQLHQSGRQLRHCPVPPIDDESPATGSRQSRRPGLARWPRLPHAALQQPQRRQSGVRPRRVSVHRLRRWRVRQRPAGAGAGSVDAAGQDAADRCQRLGRRSAGLRRPGVQSVRRPDRRARRDLGPRPAQSVALELRLPASGQHGSPRHRRRRPGRVGGSGLPAGRRGRPQLRVAEPRGRARQRDEPPGRHHAARRSDVRVPRTRPDTRSPAAPSIAARHSGRPTRASTSSRTS